MKSLKVVFFGTPDFAAASLEAIFHSHHHVAAVVTVPDKASGRGQKVHESAVKKFALQHNIPVFQPEKLRKPEFLEQMKALDADVFVVVAFRMMPKVLFETPKMGTFNLHASLLPDYRGAAPINYAIINGEKRTGVTTFFINEKIDEGHILLQEETDIDPEENAGSLHDRLMAIGAKTVVKTLDSIADNSIEEKPQPHTEHPKNAYKIFKEDTRIDWNKAGKEIHDFIRGMSPYPSAFTVLDINGEHKNLKIFAGTFLQAPETIPGKVEISKSEFKIHTADGFYFPKEVQLEGKKRMNTRDFLNGFRNTDEIKTA